MYSIALLMALTSGGEVSDGHRHGGCGCTGYVASCGCGGGHHRERHCGHRHRGGCCGETACCAPVVTYGCCGCYGGQPAPYGPAPAPAGEKLKMPEQKKTEVNAPAGSSSSCPPTRP
jgi:hypothetical protein